MATNLASLEEFESNQRWFQAHLDELLATHCNEFVAVWQNRVIDADKDIDALSDRIREKTKGAGSVYVDFVTDESIEMIL